MEVIPKTVVDLIKSPSPQRNFLLSQRNIKPTLTDEELQGWNTLQHLIILDLDLEEEIDFKDRLKLLYSALGRETVTRVIWRPNTFIADLSYPLYKNEALALAKKLNILLKSKEIQKEEISATDEKGEKLYFAKDFLTILYGKISIK